jgi:predicted transcriptional regulator
MKTADPELMRAINRLNVLDTVRRHGPISRIEISERTELSTTTVSAITASLLDDGLILPRHEGDIRNEAVRGRPRVMLELNPDAARVVGAKIAANRMVFVVTNFRGDVLSKLALPIRIDRQPIGVIADLVEDGVRRCVVDAGLSLEDVDSVCLGFPGVIEHRTGYIRSSPIFRDTNVDFAAEMSTRLATPTIVESDAHAITLGHHWFGKARDLEDMVLISLEQTLGLGVLPQPQSRRPRARHGTEWRRPAFQPGRRKRDPRRTAGRRAFCRSDPSRPRHEPCPGADQGR